MSDEAPAGSRQYEAARGNTRMRFEQWAKNPTCEANTVSAVRNVRMASVAVAEGLEPSFGQSPFALARGNRFEALLFEDDGERLRTELVRAGVLTETDRDFLDLRLRANGGARIRSMDQALAETRELLTSLPHAAEAPALVAAATVRIPKGVMLPEATLIIDALVIRRGESGRRELVVGEVKTYPDRGGHTDGAELSGARAQAGIYVHALDIVLDELGLRGQLDVSRLGFLVLTKPGSNFPSIRAGEDLTWQAERARRGFDLLEGAAQALPADFWARGKEPGDDLIDAVRRATTDYRPDCLSFCDRVTGCRQRAGEAGDPVALGTEARRYLGRVTLHRLAELMAGDPPADEAEADVLRRFVTDREVSA